MAENKHTPGPWHIYKGNPNWIMAVDPGDDTPWLIAKTEPHAGPGDATPANARLIAAAPELMAALTGMIDMYVELVESGDAGFWNAEEVHEVIAAHAAIAKATGEAAA